MAGDLWAWEGVNATETQGPLALNFSVATAVVPFHPGLFLGPALGTLGEPSS